VQSGQTIDFSIRLKGSANSFALDEIASNSLKIRRPPNPEPSPMKIRQLKGQTGVYPRVYLQWFGACLIDVSGDWIVDTDYGIFQLRGVT
jgi:hypothetical protein